MGILDRISKKIKDEKLLVGGEKVIIAFSGGPDSVFLLEILLQLKEVFNLKLVLAHVNHLLRGKDSDGDEEFVKSLGKRLELPVFVKRADINEISKERGMGLEEAGREIRYEFFGEVLKEVQGDKVALAHNKDDQIETFMFRLIRGTSLEGLEGINSKRECYIRPILDIYKSEIMKFLDEKEIEYRIDSSNFESNYTRNSIRLELIPFIEKRYNNSFKEKIFSLMEEIREANEILAVDWKDYSEEDALSEEKLLKEKTFIQKKIITHFLNSHGVAVSRNKVESVLKILGTGGTKNISLDKICYLKKEYGKIFVGRIKEKTPEIVSEVQFKVPGKIEFGDYEIEAAIAVNSSGNQEFPTNLKIGDILTIRNRKEGDKLIPSGMSNFKKLKDIFINEKVPKEERDKIPLVTYNGEIIWIAGIRGDERFKNKQKEKFIRLNVRRKSE